MWSIVGKWFHWLVSRWFESVNNLQSFALFMSADPGSIPRPVNLNFIFNSLGFSVILFMNSFKCSHLIIFEFFADYFQSELLLNLFNSFTQFQVKFRCSCQRTRVRFPVRSIWFLKNSLWFSIILFMNSFKCSHLIIFEFFSDYFQSELLLNLFNSFTQFQVKFRCSCQRTRVRFPVRSIWFF